MIKLMKPIGVALDKCQRSESKISDAVEIWKDLEEEMKSFDEETNEKFAKRYKMALNEEHFLANIFDPKYLGARLTATEIEGALEWLHQNKPGLLGDVLNLRAKAQPFSKFMFENDTIGKMKPIDWWRSQDKLSPELTELAEQLLITCASSAEVERIFSTFGIVFTKLRNRLGIEKAHKLVFLFKILNRV